MEDIRLKPFIHPRMDVLFIPLNPPPQSNSNGHFFSRVATFWDILFASRLIEQKVPDFETGDELVFGNNTINYRHAIYGIKDLMGAVIEANSSKIRVPKGSTKQFEELVARTKIICLMHNKVVKAFERDGIIAEVPKPKSFGLRGTIGCTKIFAVPFPTGSNLSKEEIIIHYIILREALDSIL